MNTLTFWAHVVSPITPEEFDGFGPGSVGGQLLGQARAALKARHVSRAEVLLEEAGDGVWSDSAALNVLGLVQEARGRWYRAKWLWVRAVWADRRAQPPRQNLRRYYELCQWGRTRNAVAFGDEPRFRRDPMEGVS